MSTLQLKTLGLKIELLPQEDPDNETEAVILVFPDGREVSIWSDGNYIVKLGDQFYDRDLFAEPLVGFTS